MAIDPRVTIITGASRGFGAAIARELAERGHQAVATMRNPDRDGAPVVKGYEGNIQVTRCDVTDTSTVESAVAFALERHGRIDAVVNNAGYGLIGAIEELQDEELHRLMDTNVTGVIRMVRAVMPAMRRQGGGKILNVSSLAGRISGPAFGGYCGSKHALEGLSEALRYEVAPFGVEVSLITVGAFRTSIQWTGNELTRTLREGRSLYQEPCEAFIQGEKDRATLLPGPRSVAAVIADAVEFADPLPLRIPVGFDTSRVEAVRAKMTDDEFAAMISGMRNTGFPGSWFGTVERQQKEGVL